jgi:ABC-2 type transport system ATP-binding protein
LWELIGALRRDGVSVLLTARSGEQQLRFRSRHGMDLLALASALPASYPTEESIAGNYPVRGQMNPKVLSAVTTWCADQGVLVDEALRSLEGIFVDLTGRELCS